MYMVYKQPKAFLKDYIKKIKSLIKHIYKYNVHIIAILSLFFNELLIYYLAPDWYDPVTLKQSSFKTSDYLI